MQQEMKRRTNKQRSDATRAALVRAARKLFVEKSYADTGTPEIVAAANVTRGALYHHFADKADLFRAVLVHEAKEVAKRIEGETVNPDTALDALTLGAEAYFAAMAVPGRARLLLLDGPSVLGHAEMDRIDREAGAEELRQGLAFAMEQGDLPEAPLDALADILSAAFDRAALAVASGRPPQDYKASIRLLLKSLLNQ